MIYFNGKIGYKNIVLSDHKLQWGHNKDRWGNPRDWCSIENIKSFRLHIESKKERVQKFSEKLDNYKNKKEFLIKEIERMEKSFFRLFLTDRIKKHRISKFNR